MTGIQEESIIMFAKYGRYVIAGIIAILIFLIVYRITSLPRFSSKAILTKANERIDSRLKSQGKFIQSEVSLSELGIMYRAHNYNITPAWYFTVRLAVGFFSMLLAYLFLNNSLAFLFLPIGYFLVNIYYKKANESDNKKIIMDLYTTYACLKTQLGAGIFIADVLLYVCNVVKNERYREALTELVCNISDRTVTIDEALNIFKHRFKFTEIDKLCALIRNYTLYGASDTYTSNIMNQIQSTLTAKNLEDESNIENKAGFVKFLFFGIIVGIVGIAMFEQFKGINLF